MQILNSAPPCPTHSRDEHVVGDVVQVTAVLEPGAGHADVVCGALAVDLDQDEGIVNVLPVPLGEWCEKLQTFAKEREIDYGKLFITGPTKRFAPILYLPHYSPLVHHTHFTFLLSTLYLDLSTFTDTPELSSGGSW